MSLEECIFREWELLALSLFQKLVGTMQKRMIEVLKGRGQTTKY